MGKIVLLVLLVLAGLRTRAQDSLTYKSVVVYKFNGFCLILSAQHITDSLLDFPAAKASQSARQRKLTVHGDLLQLYLTEVREPLHYPVRTVALDNSFHEQEETTAEDLEIRFAYIDVGRYGNWKDITSFPLLNKDSSLSLFPFNPGKLRVAKGKYFILRDQANVVYPILEVRIRNKKTKEEIVRFQARAVDAPVSPFLLQETQDDSSKKLIDSFNNVRANLVVMPNFKIEDGQVIDLDARKKPDIPKMLNNEPMYKISELVMYFKNERGYPDSSLEFRLLSQPGSDTNWIKTGHRLVIPKLVHGEHYKLQIRYEVHPGYVQEHTFYVVPLWHQTTQAKIILVCMLIFGGLLAWLLIYRRQLISSRRRREQLSLEIKSIRSQLNPHFIFNAMFSIQGLINKNEIAAANRYLTDFSSLLRDTLQNHEKEMVPLISEVNLLETYLKLEVLRFNFQYQIYVDPALDSNGTEIPTLLLQPLVENAVKHGAGPLGEKGIIRIEFQQQDQHMLVTIVDNGSRFQALKINEGYGLKLTRNRISLLGQTLREQPILLTIERSEGRETIVHLVFKNWL